MVVPMIDKMFAGELTELLALRTNMNNELDKFNQKMEAALGGDTRSMYRGPVDIVDDFIIGWLMRILGESKDGAEWFLYEAYPTISYGDSTKVEVNGKEFKIASVVDYVNMCAEVNHLDDNKEDAHEGKDSGRK